MTAVVDVPTPAWSGGFVGLMDANAERFGDDPALSWDDGGGTTRTWSWREYRQAVLEAAAGLLDLGVAAGDVVTVLASNRHEHLVADHAVRRCGAVPVSLYLTLSADQAQHILADCSPSVLIIEGQDAVDRFAVLPWVVANGPEIVTLGTGTRGEHSTVGTGWESLCARGAALLPTVRGELDRRAAAVSPHDTATLIYTSGTTGSPKGVVLTHANLLWDVDALVGSGLVDYALVSVSYLPLAHITERIWSLYLSARVAGHVHCCPDMGELLPTLQRVRPTWFMGVPRVWEKLAAAAQTFMSSSAMEESTGLLAQQRALLLDHWVALADGRAVDARTSQEAAGARQGRPRAVRTFLGLERAYASSGAAPLRLETIEFFASLGIRLIQGYGLTETGGPVVTERQDACPSRGAVGVPFDGCEVQIAGDGEVLLRSPGNTPGYHGLPQATAELLDADGWLHTGDVGVLDEAGRLHITDRKKEIIVTASGKNIAPQAVENLLVGRSFIAQVVAIGEARPFVTALITPDAAELERFAAARGLGHLSTSEIVEHPEVRAEIAGLVAEANVRLSRPEQIKSWQLLDAAFSVEDGTLTPTFKLKRRAIHDRYGTTIERLYDEATAARS